MAAKPTKQAGRVISEEHKATLASARADARVVKAYVEALERRPQRKGRQRTVRSIQRRLDAIETEMAAVSALIRLQLIQERRDLRRELAEKQSPGPSELTRLRDGFVKVARAYGERKGIEYASWREAGVDAATLRAAGIRSD